MCTREGGLSVCPCVNRRARRLRGAGSRVYVRARAVSRRVCVRCRGRASQKITKAGAMTVRRGFRGWLTGWLADCSLGDRCSAVASHSRLPPPFLPLLSAKLLYGKVTDRDAVPMRVACRVPRRLKTRPEGHGAAVRTHARDAAGQSQNAWKHRPMIKGDSVTSPRSHTNRA